jgi:ribonuclease HI
MAPSGFYAVAVGKIPGIYKTWDECKAQVTGIKNAKYKKFSTLQEAEHFVKTLGSPLLSQWGISLTKEEVAHVAKPIDDNKPRENALVVFTDGSALANGKRGARAGYAVVWPDMDDTLTFYQSIPQNEPQTNNRAEYRAAHKALTQAKEIDPSGMKTMYIYTDSQLLINSVTKWMLKWKKNGWKTATGQSVEHQDLLKEIDDMCGKRRVKWIHVDAHTGGKDWKSIWNDKADQLAKKAAIG